MGATTDLPRGTVTFLFSDIEGSTEAIARLGDARYAELQETHRAILRQAVDSYGGVEVATEGDALFVAFARASDAVAAACAGQRAIESHTWPDDARIRVRMGVHTGEALVRGRDYVGHDVHRAKRISDAGHGGQILLSQVTADLAGPSVTFRDLGPHRLKDLGEPQRILQLLADGLQAEFPPLRSLEAFEHSLPPQRTTFVGRATELEHLRGLLRRERLVTITGVGGVGKTRLAIQAGAELVDAFRDGVYFADLATLSEPDALPQAIADAVGLVLATELGSGVTGPSEERLIAHLLSKRCLLILDNCEHLLDACADIADRLLATCPDVSILATSREALDVEGEQSWRVPSLSVPGDDDAHRSEAVSLFLARARSVRPDFDLSPANAEAIAEICRRLDGIPLAIELAASRMSHLSAPEVATRLGDMFQLLAGGRRRRVQRQQTLEATLDWSYQLLNDHERTLLRRLAVFAGPFTLAAAEGVCASGDLGGESALELLRSLVAKSLVSVEEHDGRTRYRMMETVRHYAGAKLRDAGEADEFRARHRDWFLEHLMRVSPDLFFPPDHVEQIADLPNFMAALERCQDEGRLDLVIRMAVRLMLVWAYYGHHEAGHRWLTIARPEDLDLTIDERVAALEQAAYLTNVLQRPGSLELAERAIAATEGMPSVPAIRAYVQRSFARAIRAEATGDVALAEAARQDAAEVERLHGMFVGEALEHLTSAKAQRCMLELILGDYAAANAALDGLDAAGIAEWAPIAGPVAAHLAGAHEIAAERGRLAFAKFVGASTQRGGQPMTIEFASLPAVAVAGAGETTEGWEMLAEVFDDTRASGRLTGLENSVIVAAVLAHLDGESGRASRLLSWVRGRIFDRGAIPSSPGSYALYKHYGRVVRGALSAEEAQRCRAEGKSMSVDEAIALALGRTESDQAIAPDRS